MKVQVVVFTPLGGGRLCKGLNTQQLMVREGNVVEPRECERMGRKNLKLLYQSCPTVVGFSILVKTYIKAVSSIE